MRNYPQLSTRVWTFVLNTISFYLIYVALNGRIGISGSLDALWFLSAVALWLFSLLSSPWFRPPRDAFGNAISTFLVLITADINIDGEAYTVLSVLQVTGCAFSVALTCASLFAMIKMDEATPDLFARFLYFCCDKLGRGEVLYTFPALIGILGGYSGKPFHIALLTTIWIFFIVVRPFEMLFEFLQKFFSISIKQVPSINLDILRGSIIRIFSGFVLQALDIGDLDHFIWLVCPVVIISI